MKATELRIGNWVYNNNGYVMKVISIDKTDILLNIKQFEGDPFEYVINEIKPIPLTKEWLEMFGFTKGKFNYKWQFGNFIYDEKLRLWTWFGVQLHEYLIEFVHQLQNLYFALTGEELTLKEEVKP